MSAVIIGTVSYAWAYAASIRASQVMFNNVLSRVLRAPLRWLDTVPVGRIFNRFTADFSVLDSRLVNDIADFLFTLLELLGIWIAGFLVSPIMIIFAGLSVSVVVMIGRRYLRGAREVKRLESIARSPILDLFDCVRAGIATIVAYDQAERYIERYTLIPLFVKAIVQHPRSLRSVANGTNRMQRIIDTTTHAHVAFQPMDEFSPQLDRRLLRIAACRSYSLIARH